MALRPADREAPVTIAYALLERLAPPLTWERDAAADRFIGTTFVDGEAVYDALAPRLPRHIGPDHRLCRWRKAT